MNLNQSIAFAMAKTMQHLSDFVFVTLANITLARRDAYLHHQRSGIKQDTLESLSNAPLLHLALLFPHAVLRKAKTKYNP